MLPIFASFRFQSSSPTIASIGGGATTVATNYTWFLQLQNRSGRNILSTGVALNVIAGNQLEWTVPSALVASGEEVFYYVLSASPTGLDTDAVLVAKVKARDDDQQTVRPLPIVLNLSRDEHFVLSGTIPDTLSFPTAADLIPGMIRFATSTGKYYIYDDEAVLSGSDILSYGVVRQGVAATPSGYWIETEETFTSFLADTQLGADLLLRDSQAALPSPPKELSTPTEAVRVWLLNGLAADGLSDVPENTRYTIQVRVLGVDFSAFFAGKVIFENVGRVDKSTGVLSTANAGFGETIVWDGDENTIILRSDLPRGEAEVFDVVLDFDNDELELIVTSANPQILLNIVDFSSTISNTSVIVTAIGTTVLSELDKLLIVPNKRLAGNATILQRYIVTSNEVQSLAGLLTADTATQYVTISATLNGLVRVRPDLPSITSTEEIRAVVSTETGIHQLIAASPIVLNGTENLQVTVSHPVNPTTLTGTIRANYPDTLIAGRTDGDWTPTQGYLLIVDSGTVYQSPIQPVTATATQIFVFADLTGFTNIGTLPTPPANRGLYDATSVVSATTGVGAFPADTYTVYFAYVETTPNNNLTVIDHTAPPAIGTQTNSLAEVISLALIKTNNLSDVADLFTSQSNLQVGNILKFNTIALRDAYTAKLNDVAIVLDAGDGLPRNFWWDGSAWDDFANRAPYEVANIAARDALTDVISGDIVKVADGGSGQPVDQIWNGSSWLSFVGSTGGSSNIPFSIKTVATDTADLDTINLINGTTTLNLPAIVDEARVFIADYTGSQFSGSSLTVVPDGAETIEGNANYILNQDGQAVTLYGEGTNWIIVSARREANSRSIESFNGATSSIANLASEDISITIDRTALIAAVTTDVESTVRAYNSIAARTADNARALGTPAPIGIEGLIFETQQLTGDLTTDLSPTLAYLNREGPQTDDIYLKVFNESGGNSVVTVTIDATRLLS